MAFSLFDALEAIYSPNDLSALEKTVLTYFAKRADREGECFPSLTRIAEDCAISRRHVQRLVATLVAKGWLVKVNVGNRVDANRYRITPRVGTLCPQGRDTVSPQVETPCPHQEGEVGTQCPQGRDTVSPGVGTPCPSNCPYELSIELKRSIARDKHAPGEATSRQADAAQEETAAATEPMAEPAGESTVKPQKTRKARSVKQSDPGVKAIIDHYHNLFVQQFGEKPVIHGGKDGATVKRLVAAYGVDKLRVLLEAFFESKDPFIKQSGYTLGVFSSQINKLLLATRNRASPARAAPDDPFAGVYRN